MLLVLLLRVGLFSEVTSKGWFLIKGIRGSCTPPMLETSAFNFRKWEIATPSSMRNWTKAMFSLCPKVDKFMALLPSAKAWYQLWKLPGSHQHKRHSSQNSPEMVRTPWPKRKLKVPRSCKLQVHGCYMQPSNKYIGKFLVAFSSHPLVLFSEPSNTHTSLESFGCHSKHFNWWTFASKEDRRKHKRQGSTAVLNTNLQVSTLPSHSDDSVRNRCEIYYDPPPWPRTGQKTLTAYFFPACAPILFLLTN